MTLNPVAEDSGPLVITAADLLANAGDVDGTPLTGASVTLTAGSGTLVNNGDGTWDYTPAANQRHRGHFSYNVTRSGDTAAGTASLDLTPVADPPTTATVTLAAIPKTAAR